VPAVRIPLVATTIAAALTLGASHARADDPTVPAPPAPPAAPPAPAALVPPPAPAPPPALTAPPRTRYFYFGYDYGTQALYGPLWVFINRGYDVLQDHVAGRNIFTFDYGTNTGNVLHNIAHPIPAISNDGWRKFLSEEIFPLKYGRNTARWPPNYSLHLIGGGTTYTALREWFEDYDVPLPRVLSAFTLMASALVNESLENKGVRGYNTDAIADIYFFDIGGIILFSFDWPNRFFSHTVIIDDWSLQPAFTAPHGELHNVGNYFAAKWALPFYRRLRLFAWFGEATTAGLSFAVNDEYSISAAAGGAAVHIVNQSTNTVLNTVDFVPTAALFVDRRESLLASLQVTNVDDYFIHLNVYPHAFTPRGPTVGFWAVMDKHARFAGGIALARPLGIGAGYSGL
jgi:hypothetical protein